MIFKNLVKTKAYKMTACSSFCIVFFFSQILCAAVKSQSKSVLNVTSSIYNQENFENEKYQITDANLDNKYVYRNKNFLYRHDLGALLQVGGDEQAYDLRLSEAYFSYKYKNNIISAGRKKLKLSQVDEQWNLGLVNPLFNHDYSTCHNVLSFYNLNYNSDIYIFSF